MVAVLLALYWAAFVPLAGSGAGRWLGLGVLVAGGFFSYGAAGQLVGAFDLRALLGGARRNRDRN